MSLRDKGLKSNFSSIEQGMTQTLKMLRDQVVVFTVITFQFSDFYENKVKHDKGNFKKGLSMRIKLCELTGN